MHPALADTGKGAVKALGLGMHGQNVRARVAKDVHKLRRIVQHEVHIVDDAGQLLLHGLEDVGAKGEVGHEMPVHHVEVQFVAARLGGHARGLTQPKGVCRQN